MPWRHRFNGRISRFGFRQDFGQKTESESELSPTPERKMKKVGESAVGTFGYGLLWEEGLTAPVLNGRNCLRCAATKSV